jgi:hypothetical protein
MTPICAPRETQYVTRRVPVISDPAWLERWCLRGAAARIAPQGVTATDWDAAEATKTVTGSAALQGLRAARTVTVRRSPAAFRVAGSADDWYAIRVQLLQIRGPH